MLSGNALPINLVRIVLCQPPDDGIDATIFRFIQKLRVEEFFGGNRRESEAQIWKSSRAAHFVPDETVSHPQSCRGEAVRNRSVDAFVVLSEAAGPLQFQAECVHLKQLK